jgi:tetratricopeptide (TPR) repeat protein
MRHRPLQRRYVRQLDRDGIMTVIAEQDPAVALADQVHDANRLVGTGDLEGALALLAPLTSGETPYLPAQFLLSMTAWKMGRLDWALDLMHECHKKWPMHGTVAEMLASLYAQVGNLRESLFMGKLATALGGAGEYTDLIAPGFPMFDWAFYNIKDKPLLAQAKASHAKGKLLEAIEKARQHSALNPQDGDAHAFLAELLLRAGMGSVAIDVLHSLEGNIVGDGEFPAAYASLYARALTTVGAFAEARTWHAKATTSEPKDPEIAAAQILDSAWSEKNRGETATAASNWVQRFCQPSGSRQWRRPDGKLVIGYLVSTFGDPLDIPAVAAVARAHDRDRVATVGYGIGSQNWESNVSLQGAFDTWQDIRGLDPATLERFFIRGGLHIIVDAAGLAAPRNLMALARLRTAIRVGWFGNSAQITDSVYDAQIVASATESKDKTRWAIAGGYPISRHQPQGTVRVAHDGVHFGSDARMMQLSGETINLWSSVLQAHPDSKLLLRAHDMAPGSNIDRLVTLFGRELAARIDIVDAESAEEFYASVDVALTPRRGISPRMAAEALACGVLPVALAGGTQAPYGAFLQGLGLGSMLVAADDRDYASIALALATPGKARDKVLAAIEKALPSGDDGVRLFARMLEDHAVNALERAGGVSA